MSKWATKDDLSRAARRNRVREMFCEGHQYDAIAKELKVTTATVCRDVAYVEQATHREMTERLAEYKARHTLRLEHLFRKAVLGYEKSCQDRRRTTTRVKKKGPASDTVKGADEAEQTTVAEPQVAGNAAFLTEARKCSEEIAKLWGLHAPVQAQLVDADGNDVLGAVVDSMECEEARVFLGIVQEVRRRRIGQQSAAVGCVDANGNGQSATVEGNGQGHGNGHGRVIDVEPKPKSNGKKCKDSIPPETE